MAHNNRDIMRNSFFLALLLLLSLGGTAQSPLAVGPMQCHTTPRSIRLSLLFHHVTRVTLQHETASGWSGETYLRFSKEQGWNGYYAAVYVMDNLVPGKAHKFRVHTESGDQEFSYTTPREEGLGDFTFLVGSCAFIGTGAEKLYEVNPPTEIFDAMSATPHDFMLWTGDNVYYIWPEYNSAKGMVKKQTKIRMHEDIAPFISQGIHIATWDDHDYGPNNSDKHFALKDSALSIFRRFWATPTDNPGNYYKWTHQDADFFVLDDRTFRNDSAHTCILGDVQLAWLKAELKASKATFKFLVLGSQLLNPENPHETWAMYQEQKDFFAWVTREGIKGLVCLSGDRHFTEMHRIERPGTYPLYDLTCSPLTSFLRKMKEDDPELENPTRVPGTLTLQHNFGALSIKGPKGARKLYIRIMDVWGKQLWEQVISESELR
jgi:alkaline phosphatase D